MASLTELSLFSGTGGGLLATQHLLGWRTVCYVEWNEYAVEVIKARIRDGYLDDAPIWDDAFTFDGRPWAGLVDVVTAGFPCQPFSLAGKGLAENDARNGWSAVIRILREVRPQYALLENVPGLISKPYFRRILGDLAEAGFDIEQDCISAQEMGANHKRERLWLIAHTNGGSRWLPAVSGQSEETILTPRHGETQSMANAEGSRRLQQRITVGDQQEVSIAECSSEYVPNSASIRLKEFDDEFSRRQPIPARTGDERVSWWEVEPDICRVADGVAFRVDRLEGTGNGQVPIVVVEAWRRHGGH